ncbi:glycoside hydrolase family 15 protein [Pseudocolwellia agarivorans]|uniref:glycoside hydrolase family 15 protein n=1 Tax=Pseudocolwellia agarivorans TaxID=1911682 RepID=UPI000986FBC7|nr:glycoside hydrolase family 15 protein [Pseudocolwellia agarivorans]
MQKASLLHRLYEDINNIIIKRQHPVTGLLPASTAITTHGDYTDAWVRDNVYSILSVWSLSMAFKRGGDKIKCDELEQSTIKLMRGLLTSMMRQSDKVEKFKATLDPMDCLHAKYSTTTGLTVVGDDEWGHLQIDATSIFLLMIGQMSASGLRIIKTIDEVDFIQNLVYYIAFAYRTPDYGIWERGNKINNGKTEINASSVGMAKAALQALDGFNLFGKDANPRAIIHTIPDAVSRARNTLAHLLPRESMSKEVDSALLSIIGFPAFAVSDKQVIDKTKNKILSELGGDYGCKRFLWDGHQTAVEDHSRIHYEHSELANFANIESEWPLFYTYLYIQALFDNDADEAKKYKDKLEAIMVDVDGKKLLPELYYVEDENIEAERRSPGSQPRTPNENIPLVWAQSLYFTGLMLDEGVIEKNDLDPLQLRFRSTKNNEAQLALVVLAENNSVKQQLAEKGVIAETINEISPINVITAEELVECFRKVGANESLKLTGRPKRRLQGLATAQTYTFNGKAYLSLSSLQHKENNYRIFDAELASEHLKGEVEHINKHWINDEAAVFTYLLTQDMCDSVNADVLLDTLRSLQLRATQTNIGYASASLAYRASRVNKLVVPNFSIQALANTPEVSDSHIIPFDFSLFSESFQIELKSLNYSDKTSYEQLMKWNKEYQLDSHLPQNIESAVLTQYASITFKSLVESIYSRAQHKQHWLTARLCFSILKLSYKDLADDVSQVCARHISIVVGQKDQTVLNGEHALLKPKKLVKLLDETSDNLLERTLIQELLVILGNTIRIDTQLFNGLRSIKLNSVLTLCVEHSECTEESLILLSSKSPAELNTLVQKILNEQQEAFNYNIEYSYSAKANNQNISYKMQAIDTDWLQWRTAKGLITRIDDVFLTDIWQSLSNTQRIIFGDNKNSGEVLDSTLIRASMTPREESFAKTLDALIQHLHPIYYKSAIVEVLYAFTQYCMKYPDCQFEQIVLGEVIEQMAKDYVNDLQFIKGHERSLDILMAQAPDILQKYAFKVFESF